MPSARRVPLVSVIGVLWPGLVLLTLFTSTIVAGMREFVMSLSFGVYIAIWLAIVAVPSVVMVWIGEKRPETP